MNNLLNSVQSFFHSVTTNDRYATYGSDRHSSQAGYSRRTASGGYGPASRLTSDEETLYNSSSLQSNPINGDHPNNPYQYSSHPSSGPNSSSNLTSPASSTSLNRLPYTPGMRSSQIGNSGSIPLQDYSDGVPPPPPPALSWKRIDRWMDVNYPELLDQINDEATSLDLNEFESDIDCTLPLDVRDSFMIHDGQERGSRPCGVLFGITMLDLESVAEEWGHWKNTAIKLANLSKAANANQRAAAGNGEGPSSSPNNPRKGKGASGLSKNFSWLNHQESVPDGAVQCVYAHPAWIPLASDYLGNNIGIDLAPGPKGRWGQVILFGREYDRKYVVAPSWAAFLMIFADDLENGNHLINDEYEEGELSFRASNGRVVPYFDVLRSRTERLHQPRKPLPSNLATSLSNSSSQTSIAGPRESPRNLTPSGIAGRNVSGNFRKQTPSQFQEGRLISPLNSATHLPSIGLSKHPLPSKAVKTPEKMPLGADGKSPQSSPLKSLSNADDPLVDADAEVGGSEIPSPLVSESKQPTIEATSTGVKATSVEPTETKADSLNETKPVVSKASGDVPASAVSVANIDKSIDLLETELTDVAI